MAPGSKFTFRLSRLACLLAGLSVTGAHASYTVIDDDLFPTAVVEARQAPRTRTEHHEVPFARRASALGPLGRRAVEQLVGALNGAAVQIIGRPDATPSSVAVGTENPAIIPLAVARSNAIRQHMTRLGVQASRITEAPDNSPNPQTDGSIYPSYLIVTREAAPSQYAPLAAQPAPQPAAWPAATPAASAKPPSVTGSVVSSASQAADRDRLIQFINQSVQAGAMDASVALTLMSRMVNAQTASVPQPVAPAAPQQAAATAAPAAPAPLFLATPALARKDKWELNKALTLRDNLGAWSKQAGWNPSQWEASNYFQVLTSATLEGEFPEILRQIADSTGLNMCANKAQKFVRVTDAGIRCDK